MTATKVLRSHERARVRVYTLELRDRRVEIKQPVLRAGSHEENDLVIEGDDAVSRIHFEIVAEERGYRLRDLGSTNGTFIDGLRVVDAYLKPSCRITAGVTTIAFELGGGEAELLCSERDRFGPLVGKSAAMRALFATLEQVAPSDCTVLIQGESGTGKEVLAEAIHAASARKGGPFVVFDCGAVAANLLESELFGHEKGAFTGATGERAGCLEAADGGTLLLDEIGELPLDLQPKLLRAVEKREVRRLGSNKAHTVDVRILAATNRDLASEVNQGSFRADLYYRLAVVRLEIPPLRSRAEDIPLLVEHQLERILRGDRARIAEILGSISPDTWRKMQLLPWRGNVRELRNFVERRVALGEEPTAPAAAAPASGGTAGAKQIAVDVDLERPFFEQREALEAEFERAYLRGVLEAQGGNISRAAAVARIDRMYFKRLLKKYQ